MVLLLGATLAFLGVALGAFGAHALKDKFKTERYAAIWDTAVQYQMYHALGLMGIAILKYEKILDSNTLLEWAGYLMFAGVLFFSGSLYVLALTGIKKLGAITPIGGILFLASWALVAIVAFG